MLFISRSKQLFTKNSLLAIEKEVNFTWPSVSRSVKPNSKAGHINFSVFLKNKLGEKFA